MAGYVVLDTANTPTAGYRNTGRNLSLAIIFSRGVEAGVVGLLFGGGCQSVISIFQLNRRLDGVAARGLVGVHVSINIGPQFIQGWFNALARFIGCIDLATQADHRFVVMAQSKDADHAANQE